MTIQWTPDLSQSDGPIYARILAGLASDIEAGVLPAGTQLPTQRRLSERLGISLGAVTRAYAEAEARGLIEAVVGRGSFVASRPPPRAASGPIDLARNVPPMALVADALRRSFVELARRADLAELVDYPPAG